MYNINYFYIFFLLQNITKVINMYILASDFFEKDDKN